MKMTHMVAWILVMIGGINWLLVGIGAFMGTNLNVVNLLLGSWPQIESIVYIVVGLAAVYEIVKHKANCKMCSSGSMM